MPETHFVETLPLLLMFLSRTTKDLSTGADPGFEFGGAIY